MQHNSCANAEKIQVDTTVVKSYITIKGISMVAPVMPLPDTALTQIAAVNANSIAVMPYAFFSTENPEIRFNHKGGWWGESKEGVIGSINLAHKQKLSIMLKPHLWMGRGMYTGAFTLATENEWKRWEESYRKYMYHFALIADSMHAAIFCIGTELGASIKERPQFWNDFIDSIRSIYHGKLTYAANWDDYKHVPFWHKLDYIGVDAYFPLSDEKNPSLTTLQNGFKKYRDELEALSIKHDRPILFTEYGYRNVDFAAAEPWKESDENRNDEAQANAYEALYNVFATQKWFAGGYVWKWYIEKPRRQKEVDYTPQNKLAESVISNWYGK